MKCNEDDYMSISMESENQFWKKKKGTPLNVEFFEKYKEDSSEELLDILEEEIDWVENNKNKFEEILIENNALEIAENIASSAPLLECLDEECYLMRDDSKVSFPITDDDFCDSLYICDMISSFDEERKSTHELLLSCDPPYLEEHCFIFHIDKDKNIIFHGLYEDYINSFNI